MNQRLAAHGRASQDQAPDNRCARLLARLAEFLRTFGVAAAGAAMLMTSPAAANDCIPTVIKTHNAAPSHTVVHRPHRKAVAQIKHKPRLKTRHVAHARARHLPLRPAVAIAEAPRPPAAVAPLEIARLSGPKRDCATTPAGAPMSIMPSDVVTAANQLPFDQSLIGRDDALPAFAAGQDASAVESDGTGRGPSLSFGPPTAPGGPGGLPFEFSGVFPSGGSTGGGVPGVPGPGDGGPPPTPGGPTPPTALEPTSPTDNPTPGPTPGVEQPFTPPSPPGGGEPPINPFQPLPGGPGQPSTGTPGSGVPEPSTWAMMIAGFGLAGAALRRRRTANTSSLTR